MSKSAIAIVFLSFFLGCTRQPQKPLELHLTLGKQKIKAGEYLWYLLELKNVGRKPLRIGDPFWCWQAALTHNQGDTRLEVIGPDGRRVPHRNQPYGFNLEHAFWDNECGEDKPCACEGSKLSPRRPLGPGETLAASPSLVAPVRPRFRDVMGDPGDMRQLPPFLEERVPKERLGETRRKWKEDIERDVGYLLGDPGFKPDPKEAAVERPKGYRVLDVYTFTMPGSYRMRFVFAPLPSRHMGWPAEIHNSWFEYESNWVRFEVVPGPFPEHMFRPRANETTKERSLREELKRTARESFIWADDSAVERERKARRDREMLEQEDRRREKLDNLLEMRLGARPLQSQTTGQAHGKEKRP